MGYVVTFYYGTKLNTVNTIDDYTKVPNIAKTAWTAPTCDIMHIRGLSSFIVDATYEQVKDADLCFATNGIDFAFFDIIGDPTPTDMHTVSVPVHIDPLLTTLAIMNSDISHLTFLDGFVERHHVAKIDDTFGAYTEADPYMIPSEPLQIEDAGILFNNRGSDVQLIEASLDIGQMGTGSATALTYTDSNTGKDVTVPKTIPLGSIHTDVVMNIPHETGTPSSVPTPVTAYFDATRPPVQAGLAKCRDLGAEGSILNSWIIPRAFLSGTPNTAADGRIIDLTSVSAGFNPDLNFVYEAVQNMRVLTGSANRYCLQAVGSGNIGEYNPEYIYHAGDTSPLVEACADLRPNGKPYFRFEYFMGNTDFFMNCITGLEWQKAPLMYTQKSGLTIDKTIFYSERADNAELFGYSQRMGALNAALSAGGAALSAGIGIAGAQNTLQNAQFRMAAGDISGIDQTANVIGYKNAQQGLASSIANGVFNAGTSAISGVAGYINNENIYNIQKQKELRRFSISQSVVTPQIQYPRDEGLRDFLGNGVRCYRYRYSAKDCQKIDTVLNMFGYKDTTVLKPEFFTNRSKFNYIEASGISVESDIIPMWLKDELTAQLENGVRIWHVKPDSAAYTDGTNI